MKFDALSSFQRGPLASGKAHGFGTFEDGLGLVISGQHANGCREGMFMGKSEECE